MVEIEIVFLMVVIIGQINSIDHLSHQPNPVNPDLFRLSCLEGDPSKLEGRLLCLPGNRTSLLFMRERALCSHIYLEEPLCTQLPGKLRHLRREVREVKLL